MDPLLEIRKLPPSVIRQLGSLLDYGDQWKDLMGIVPKQLPKDDFEANISDTNPAKYTADDIQIIAQGAIQLKKSPTAILIDEWGTSGRPRANLGHLAHLLTQANLFRAADYVSVDLLKNPPVIRPQNGPSSTIKLEINDWMRSKEAAYIKNIKNPGLGTLLKMIDYPGLDDISENLSEMDCEEIKTTSPKLEFLLNGLEYPNSETEVAVDSETKSTNDETNSENTRKKFGKKMVDAMYKILNKKETADLLSNSSMLSGGDKKDKKTKNEKRKLRMEQLQGMNIQFSENSLENSSVPPISMLLEEVQISPTKVFPEKSGSESSNNKSREKSNHNFLSGLINKFKTKQDCDDSEVYSNIPAFSLIMTDPQFTKYQKKVKDVDDVTASNRTRRNSL